MRSLFGEVISEHKATTVPLVQPTAVTAFLVATWYSPDMSWKLRPEQWLTREAAEKSLKENTARGHTHYTIFEIRFPGL